MRKWISFFVVLFVISGFVSMTHDSATAKRDKSFKKDVTDSLESFSRFIFECVKKNDFASYSKHIASREQILHLVEIAKQIDSTKFNLDRDIEAMIKEQTEKANSTFGETYQEGIAMGIDWKNADYIRTTYSVSNEVGIDLARITILFKHAGTEYELRVRDLIKFGKRWYSFSKMSLDSKDWDYDEMDTTTVYVDSLAPVPDTSSVDLQPEY